jgi:hypothetical protein
MTVRKPKNVAHFWMQKSFLFSANAELLYNKPKKGLSPAPLTPMFKAWLLP